MSFADSPDAADDALTTPQTDMSLDDAALTTPHEPSYATDALTAPQTPMSTPLTFTDATSPYIPDGQSLAPPPPPNAGRSGVRAGLTAAILVVVVALVAGVALAAKGGVGLGTPASAASVAQSYCHALTGKHYTQGYTLLAPSLQSGLTAADYTTSSQELDTQAGAVTGCAVGKASASGATTTIPVTVTRQQSSAQSLTWIFSKSGSTWRLTQYPDPSLAARVTLRRYCAAVVGGQYATAYALFSAAVQTRLVSAATYASVAGDADAATGKATACTTSGVAVAADGTTTGHLTLTRNQADSETVALSATTTGSASITSSPDASLPSRVTAATFCNALIKKDYNTAFAQFTPSAQSAIGSPSSFQQSVQSATFFTGDITGCHAGAFALNGDNQSGTLNGQTITHNILGDQTHGTTLTMVAQSDGSWLIDDATIDGISLSSGGGFPGLWGDQYTDSYFTPFTYAPPTVKHFAHAR